jgi:hypothetical protein
MYAGAHSAPDRAGQNSRRWMRIRGLNAHLLVLGVFVALSVILTYPLVKDLGSRILGPPAPGDNFEYLYKVWWFKHALFDLHISPFFNPDMFYPFGYPVTLSETTLANTIPALPLTLLFGEVVAYNLTILISFVLSGFGMYLLVLYLTGSRQAGLVSGVVFAFCPYRMLHLGSGHLPLMGTQWLPLLFLYLDKMLVRQRASDGLMAAVFYALGALTAWYYAYIFALAGAVYVLLRGRQWRQYLWQRRFARCALTFVAACLLLVGPFVLPVTQLWKEGARPQSLKYLDSFSASPLDFVYPNVLHPLWGEWLLQHYQQPIENILYLGLTPLILAALALWRRRSFRTPRPKHGVEYRPRTDRGMEYRQVGQAFAWLSLLFVVLALGTTLHWQNAPVYIGVPDWLERIFTAGMGLLTKRLALYPISSYSLRVEGAVYLPLPTLLLYLYLPFFGAMRVWARMGFVAIFGVSVLAGYGFQRLDRQCLRPSGLARRRAGAVTLIVLACVILEFAAFPHALGSSSVQARPVDYWLASQEGDFAIMEFPVLKAMTGRQLYAMRTHGKKISFGYGTFFPRAFNESRAVLDAFPGQESVALLKSWGVRYVLVGSRYYGGDTWAQLERDCSAAPGLRFVRTVDDDSAYSGDRVLRWLPGTERAFIVDRIYVYEVL